MLRDFVVLVIKAGGVKPGSKEKWSSQVLELNLALGDFLGEQRSSTGWLHSCQTTARGPGDSHTHLGPRTIFIYSPPPHWTDEKQGGSERVRNSPSVTQQVGCQVETRAYFF